MSIHEFAEPFFRRITNNNKEAGGSILVVTGTFSDMRQVNLYSLQTYFSHYGLSIFFSLHFAFVNFFLFQRFSNTKRARWRD